MQGHVALEFDCANLKCSRWDEDRAAAIVCAGIDCRLKRGSVECDGVALGSEVTNVIDAGTQVASWSSMCSGLGCKSGFSQQTHSGCAGECACRSLSQPLTAGQEGTIDFRRRWSGVHRKASFG